jgi:hypothetical protein
MIFEIGREHMGFLLIAAAVFIIFFMDEDWGGELWI